MVNTNNFIYFVQEIKRLFSAFELKFAKQTLIASLSLFCNLETNFSFSMLMHFNKNISRNNKNNKNNKNINRNNIVQVLRILICAF